MQALQAYMQANYMSSHSTAYKEKKNISAFSKFIYPPAEHTIGYVPLKLLQINGSSKYLGH